MGGSNVIAYAGKYPERVAGLMVVGTPGKSPEEMSKPVIASLESDAYQQVMDNYMKQLLTNAKPQVNEEVMKGIKNISREASVAIIKAVFKFDPVPLLSNCPGPKLIVSTTMEKQPHALSNSFPGVPHKEVEGTSHWMQMDKPEEFNQILDGFLGSVSSAH
jgi:pimeloyl-ACP methyl ester carboxylesterase